MPPSILYNTSYYYDFYLCGLSLENQKLIQTRDVIECKHFKTWVKTLSYKIMGEVNISLIFNIKTLFIIYLLFLNLKVNFEND